MINRIIKSPLIGQFILLLTGIIIFGQVLTFDYNLDDEIVLFDDEASLQWNDILDVLSKPYFSSSDYENYGYRPLTSFSFFVENQLFGNTPDISHLINLVLYAFLVFLVFRLCNLVFSSNALAFLCTLLFLIHPLHVEVVASVKNRDEILALIFAILSFLSLKNRSVIGAIVSLILVYLSILSKKSGLGLLLLIPFLSLGYQKNPTRHYIILSAGLVLALFVFLPSYSLFVRIFFSFGLAGFYVVGERFLSKHNAKLSKGFTMDILAFSAVMCSVYGFVEIKVWLLVIGVTLSVVNYFLSQNSWHALFLLLITCLFSIVTTSWGVLIFSMIFIGYHEKILMRKVSFILVGSGLLFYQMGQVSEWLGIIFLMIYSIPFLIPKAQNRWISYGMIFSIFSALTITIINDFKVVNVMILGAFLLLYLLLLYKRIFPLLFGAIAILLAFIVTQEPYMVPKEMVEDRYASSLEEVAVTANSGRELHFIENPLIDQSTLIEKLSASLNTYGYYLKSYFAPTPLSAYYGFNTIDLLNVRMSLVWVALIVSIFLLLRRFPNQFLSFGLLIFIFSLLPFSNLFFPVAGIVGDRLMFTSTLVLSIVLVRALSFMNGNLKKASVIVFVGWLGFLGFLTLDRLPDWKSKETLLIADADKFDKSVKLNELAADWYYFQSDLDRNLALQKASIHFTRSARAYPEYDRSWYMLGLIKQEQGNFKDALTNYMRIETPDFSGPDLFLNIAICSVKLGDFGNADDYFKKAILIEETSLIAYKGLIDLYIRATNPRLALSANDAALSSFPEDGQLYESQAFLRLQLGDSIGALQAVERAIQFGQNTALNRRLVEDLQ